MLLKFKEAHVWQMYLPQARAYRAQWEAWLSSEERDRAQRFLRREDCDRFCLSRGGLRYLLAQYLSCLPESLVFQYSPYGKPILASPATALHFNLAHSGEWVVYGVSLSPYIGVDVEVLTNRSFLESLIERCLTPQEIATLPVSGRDRCFSFFKYWTVKEAHLKAVGLGLSYPMAQVQVGWVPELCLEQPVAMADITAEGWTAELWQPGEGAIAAACVGELCCDISLRPFPFPHKSTAASELQ